MKSQIKQLFKLSGFMLLVFLAVQCKHEPQQYPDDPGNGGDPDPLNDPIISINCTTDTVYFQNDVLPLLVSNCASCHSKTVSNNGVILTDYASVIKTTVVVPGSPEQSEIVKKITAAVTEGRMPPAPANGLTGEQIAVISKWIEQGAINNQCNSERVRYAECYLQKQCAPHSGQKLPGMPQWPNTKLRHRPYKL